jgi:hypothetical protein
LQQKISEGNFWMPNYMQKPNTEANP